jgi:ribosomal protein S18 acetylase RimI-like enzyme
MSIIKIRPYRGSDEPALLQLWNRTIIQDPIDAATFRTRVLLDLNFKPEGFLIAEVGNEPVGFLLSITRQVSLFLQDLEPDRGWITAFGVHPEFRRQGIATQLFEQALASLEDREILISPYTPNYFIPGVDRSAYPEAVAFLKTSGWEVVSSPISMQADLTGFQFPAEIQELEESLERDHQIRIHPVTSADLPDLLPFIGRHFGWDWVRFAREYLLTLFGPGSDEICFLVARKEQRIVGYCQQRRERFGPFGVDPALRSLGIGRVLLFRCLATMLAKGFHCAWFLWTGPDASRLYSVAGFRTVRQFAVLRRDLRATTHPEVK